MRKHNANYVIVGLFIVAMLGGALVSASLLTGRTGARDSYFTVLDNVADVAFGTQVRYDGYPVGQVEEIVPVVDGARMRFRLELGIDRGWRIPTDSIARIGSTSFLAAKTVDIESGRAEAIIATGGDIPSGAASDIFATMSGIAAEFGDLNQKSIKPLIDRIAVLVDETGGELQRNLSRLMTSLNALAATMERRTPVMLEQVSGLIDRLDTSAAGLQEILSAENAASVRRLLVDAERVSGDLLVVSGQLSETVAKVDHLVANLDGLMAENRDGLDQSLEDVQYTLNSVARNIDAIVHNLEGSSRNMNEFSRLIRQNPGLLLNGPTREEISSPYGTLNGTPQ